MIYAPSELAKHLAVLERLRRNDSTAARRSRLEGLFWLATQAGRHLIA